MNCPVCDVPLRLRQGETETEHHESGNYPRVTVSQWWSYECPSCRRATRPHGAREWAANAAREWKEAAA